MIIYCGVGDCIHNECNYCETETVEINKNGQCIAMGKVRPEVIKFAKLMEKVLRRHDYKGGWENCTGNFLLAKIQEECNELTRAMKSNSRKDIIDECADLANICMMIADIWSSQN